MVEGCETGLQLIDGLKAELGDYYLWWATRADLNRRLGRWDDAAEAYREALRRVSNGAGNNDFCGGASIKPKPRPPVIHRFLSRGHLKPWPARAAIAAGAFAD